MKKTIKKRIRKNTTARNWEVEKKEKMEMYSAMTETDLFNL